MSYRAPLPGATFPYKGRMITIPATISLDAANAWEDIRLALVRQRVDNGTIAIIEGVFPLIWNSGDHARSWKDSLIWGGPTR